jgi:hypothetical protein
MGYVSVEEDMKVHLEMIISIDPILISGAVFL